MIADSCGIICGGSVPVIEEWRGGKPKYKLTAEQIDRTPRLVKILKLDSNAAGGTP